MRRIFRRNQPRAAMLSHLRKLPTLLFWAILLSVSACTSERGPTPPADSGLAKFDLHAHYEFDRDFLEPLLDSLQMRANLVEVHHMGDPAGREAWQAYRAVAAAHPDRFTLTATFDATRIDTPTFADDVIAQLRGDLEAGAVMVKVWKEIGMGIKDASGAYIQIDDPRFQPIWDFLSERGIPVLAHIGEPRAAWLPLDPRSPHYGYYAENPQYHAYQHPEIPRWETIMQARDNWLARNPGLSVVGAHLGSMAYDVDEIARRLDAYPNFLVETSARFGDLALQPSEKVRAFFLRYADRILYGTDAGIGRPGEDLTVEETEREKQDLRRQLLLHLDYVTGTDSLNFRDYGTSYDAPTRSLDLPEDVLHKFYHQNAERLLGLQVR